MQTATRTRFRSHVIAVKDIDLHFQEQKQQRARATGLLNWEGLEAWQKWDNELIQTGYRPATASFKACLQSCGYLHNESVNVFSHLIGALLFCALPFGIYHELQPRYHLSTVADIIVFGVYAAGVAICFALSACYHLFMSHSETVFHFGFKLDYQGVIILMWSATVPLLHYTFLCEPRLQMLYLSVVSGCGILASIMTFTPRFSDSNTHRTGVFSTLAISTLLSVLHGILLHGFQEQNRRFPMWSIGLTALLNSFGACVYALRFPEMWWRRTFDIFGSSHQIMHVMIVMAGLAWWVGCLRAFDMMKEQNRDMC